VGILKHFTLVVLFTAVTAPLVDAQTVRGAINGMISDSTGKALSGASIEIREEDTGRITSVRSTGRGSYVANLLPPGNYRVSAKHTGYVESSVTLKLDVNQEARVDLALVSADRKDQVTVNSSPSLLKTESASVSGVIGTRQIQGLPLDGRNFYELGLMLPGVAPAAQGSSGSLRGDFAFNVNGAREDFNLFLLDGVYNSDAKLNGIGVQPPVDGVREFELATSSYDASFGRNAGGQMNVVLRSGTNQVHGTVYEFFRNNKLDSRNYFAPKDSAQKYNRNQFGFSLGGPIVRNRTFFFMDYEARRTREGIVRVTNVPTALERVGDFSQSNSYAIDIFTQQLFPGNKIPVERIHPTARALAALYPLPNRAVPGQNFVSSPSLRDRNDQFDVRFDHALTARTELSGRISMGDRDYYEPFAGSSFPAIPGYGVVIPQRNINAMASVTHSFTPTFVNELRLGFNRVGRNSNTENAGTNLNQKVGLPTIWGNPRDNGLTAVSITGFSPLGDDYTQPQKSALNSYQLIDQLSLATGRHLFKFGMDIRKLEQNAFRDVQSRGFLNFSGFSGNALAEMLQGVLSASGYARSDNPQYLRTQSYNFFAHDTFRLSPRATLNYGIRYEYNTPGVDKFNRANVYDPLTGGLAAVGQNGFPRGAYNPDRNNIAPRIGLAYSLNSATVIRTGYGVYFDQGALAPGEGLYFSPPYYNFNLFVALQTYFLNLSDPFPRDYPFPLPGSATAFGRNLRTPYLQHWNFTLERAMGKSTTVEAGYVGSKGTKLYSWRDVNQPRPTNAASYLRPNPYFDDVTLAESRANSNYHSLQLRLQQRLRRGVTALVSYTYSKSLDDTSGFFQSTGDPNFPQNSYDLSAERGRSSFDIRQRAVASYSYDLPFGKGKLWGGWQTLGIWTFQTGRPFTVALNPDFDNSNTGRSVLGFGANDRPNLIANPNLSTRTVDRWFNTAAFAVPTRGTFGNAGRNIVDGPGLQTINLSLIKNTMFSERYNLQFRSEFFNALDRANFGLPDNFVGNPTFGRILTAGDPRRVQLGLKLLF
jgi:hypothetical protein